MNKRGEENELNVTIILLVLTFIFVISIFTFVRQSQDNAAFWEQYYASEIVKVIDSASRGSEFYLDISRGAGIAYKYGRDIHQIFTFDNRNHVVTVSLKPGTGTSLSYFTDFTVSGYGVEEVSGGVDTTRLHFFIT